MVHNSSSGRTIDHYKFVRQVGDGTFGTAWSAVDVNNKNKVCVKIFKGLDKETQDTFAAEVQAGQAGLRHENVIRLIDANQAMVKKNGQNTSEAFYIASEFCEYGEAYDFCDEEKGLKPFFARQLFSQLLNGVEYIHSKGVAHRDLKLENCFLDKSVTLKVADFGMAKAFEGSNGKDLSTRCGTLNYMAPELLRTNVTSYDGPKVDIFALGAILYIMTQGGFAFTNANDEYYRKLHKHPNQYIAMRKHAINTTDPQFFDLILKMTKRDPNSRLSIQQIRNHHWMKQEMATPEQLAAHYKKIMIDAKMTKAQLEAQKAKERRAAFATRVRYGAQRGEGSNLPELDEFKDLEFCPYDKDELELPTRGFWAKQPGPYVMAALVEFLKNNSIEHTVHDERYQIDFKYIETAEPLVAEEGEESSEEALEIPDQEVSVKVKLCADEDEEEEEENENKKVFVNVYRTAGTAVTFSNIIRKLMHEESGVGMFIENN